MILVITNPVFGQNLKQLRRKHGLTRFALAKQLGLPWWKLWKLENPRWPSRGMELESVAFFNIGKVFGLDPHKLLYPDFLSDS